MVRRRWLACFLAVLALTSVLAVQIGAQSFAPPEVKPPDDATLKAITAKMKELAEAIGQLGQARQSPLANDIEVFLKAAAWIIRHNEWYHEKYPQWTLEILDRGLERARQLRRGQYPWLTHPGRFVRGYRSRIDGSIQPYGVVLPRDFGKDPSKRWRLDLVLHGRDASLTEVKFLHQHDSTAAAPDQDFIQLNIYGRGNNAYRWAGEVDVYEVFTDFTQTASAVFQRDVIDRTKVLIRGFSMGGAGAWHIGLHRPHYFCAVSPGAGFTTTHGYVKGLPNPLPDYQEKCLRIYDAVHYAENAFNTPFVAYGGEKDPQLQAARNIEERLKQFSIPMTLIVGPDIGHKVHPESEKEIFRLLAQHAEKARREYPSRVRFVTYTPIYNGSFWVMIMAQERQYERSLVDAERTEHGFKVRTVNVRQLALRLPDNASPRETQQIEIDGQELEARPVRDLPLAQSREDIALEKRDGVWRPTMHQRIITDALRQPRKNHMLPGPIDVAFTQTFLCVRGAGKPWHAATHQYAEANLRRFRREWSKYFRGELAVKDDTEVTAQDMETCHLVLFGDPGSNSLIAQALDRLPLQWTRDRITFAGKDYVADSHVPVMIYPSPFHQAHYVVINTGHTFHQPEFEGTNALLYPRLGDYAVLKLTPKEKDPVAVEVATAGLFNESWQLESPR